jgi:hypothetical protein
MRLTPAQMMTPRLGTHVIRGDRVNRVRGDRVNRVFPVLFAGCHASWS